MRKHTDLLLAFGSQASGLVEPVRNQYDVHVQVFELESSKARPTF